MVLDHGGPDFAFILYASAVKLLVLASPLIHILLPIPPAFEARGVLLFVAGALGMGVLVGLVESVMARLRLVRVPQFLVGATVLAALGLLVSLARGGR
jgi:formate hydrogenlyase subunit 4